MRTAYYFLQHMYTLVPKYVREDMAWLADVGTDNVACGILECDLFASKWNVQIICDEAAKRGIKVFAVPSRWGGLVAGAPKVPSLFGSKHPDTWALKRDGQPQTLFYCGPVCSVHHPTVYEFFCRSIREMLTQWPIAGIIWDEPKNLEMEDYSPAARQVLGDAVNDPETPLRSAVGFYNRINAYARQVKADVSLSLFTFAHASDVKLRGLATIEPLDYLGVDGRPWGVGDVEGHEADEDDKLLLTEGGRALAAARAAGKGGLFLIENHNLPASRFEAMDRRLPEVLAMRPEHLIYYYYPRNVPDPDRAMGILRKHLKQS